MQRYWVLQIFLMPPSPFSLCVRACVWQHVRACVRNNVCSLNPKDFITFDIMLWRKPQHPLRQSLHRIPLLQSLQILLLLPSAFHPRRKKIFCTPLPKIDIKSRFCDLAQPASLLSSSLHCGELASKLPQTLIDQSSKPFQFTLVGKYSHGRPTLEKARLYFAKFNLKGAFNLVILTVNTC